MDEGPGAGMQRQIARFTAFAGHLQMRHASAPLQVELHAGLVYIHGPPEEFAKAEQLEFFAVALDLIDQHGSDAANLLIKAVWADGVSYEVAEFRPQPSRTPSERLPVQAITPVDTTYDKQQRLE